MYAACDRSGYRRQAAVEQLDITDPMAVPVLALRAADWVYEVREPARQALTRAIVANAGALLFAAPVGFALASKLHGGWLALLLREELAACDEAVVRRALESADRPFRREVVRVMISRGVLTSADAVRMAERDRDEVVRSLCAQAAFDLRGSAHDVRGFLSSRSSPLRAHAVADFARNGDVEPARIALSDRTRTVRAIAQASVTSAGEDPAAFYRRELRAVRVVTPALVAGLRETGTAADAELVRIFLGHERPRVRLEAVRSLTALGGADPDDLLPVLSDPSPAVVSWAARALLAHARRLDGTSLRALLESSEPNHVRRAALRLLGARDALTRIAVDLEYANDVALGEYARVDLQRFIERDLPNAYLVSDADPERVADIAARLTRDGRRLPTRTEAALRFALGLAPRPPQPSPTTNHFIRLVRLAAGRPLDS